MMWLLRRAGMAELADALDLGFWATFNHPASNSFVSTA